MLSVMTKTKNGESKMSILPVLLQVEVEEGWIEPMWGNLGSLLYGPTISDEQWFNLQTSTEVQKGEREPTSSCP
jgi:hypothetical protein